MVLPLQGDKDLQSADVNSTCSTLGCRAIIRLLSSSKGKAPPVRSSPTALPFCVVAQTGDLLGPLSCCWRRTKIFLHQLGVSCSPLKEPFVQIKRLLHQEPSKGQLDDNDSV
ncbi:unnamed protein product [Eretmochelys imbricata]